MIALLEAMGPSLARYKETFSQEVIDGDLLALCTEDVLENDLGNSINFMELYILIVCRLITHLKPVDYGTLIISSHNYI